MSELGVAKDASYKSHLMIDEFLTLTSSCVEKGILDKMRCSPAVSILCDESTDVANIKQLVIFSHFLFPGQFQSYFLKVTDLLDGRADTIEKKLVDVCMTCQIPLSKIQAFGSEEAAVMTGRCTGVAKRLKAHNPEMISIHCAAHRLALASSQAAAKVPYLKKFDSHLTSVFYYFDNSPVREASLHEIQKLMEQPILCLKKAVHTRWLSHDQAVTAIRRTMPSLLATLEKQAVEKKDAVAWSLLSAMTCYNFVVTIYLLSDALPGLTALSLVFQT